MLGGLDRELFFPVRVRELQSCFGIKVQESADSRRPLRKQRWIALIVATLRPLIAARRHALIRPSFHPLIDASRRGLIAPSFRPLVAVSPRGLIAPSFRPLVTVSRRALIALSLRPLAAVSRWALIAPSFRPLFPVDWPPAADTRCRTLCLRGNADCRGGTAVNALGGFGAPLFIFLAKERTPLAPKFVHPSSHNGASLPCYHRTRHSPSYPTE